VYMASNFLVQDGLTAAAPAMEHIVQFVQLAQPVKELTLRCATLPVYPSEAMISDIIGQWNWNCRWH